MNRDKDYIKFLGKTRICGTNYPAYQKVRTQNNLKNQKPAYSKGGVVTSKTVTKVRLGNAEYAAGILSETRVEGGKRHGRVIWGKRVKK